MVVMANITEKIDATDFLHVWQELWYWWNESNDIIYDTLVVYKRTTDFWSKYDISSHIWEQLESIYSDGYHKQWSNIPFWDQSIIDLFLLWEFDNIPYMHILRVWMWKYIKQLVANEIDEIMIISD